MLSRKTRQQVLELLETVDAGLVRFPSATEKDAKRVGGRTRAYPWAPQKSLFGGGLIWVFLGRTGYLP